MTDITFIAPDGTAIAGVVQHTDECQPWPVHFHNPDSAWSAAGDIDYFDDGPDAPDWDSLTVGDMPVFEDESGIRWLPHHLINVAAEDVPVDPDTGAFSPEYCQLASWETQLALIHVAASDVLKTLEDSGSGALTHARALVASLGAELATTRREAANQRFVEMSLAMEAAGDRITVTGMAEPLPRARMKLYRALHDAFADVVDAPLDGRLVIEGDALKALCGMVKAISESDPAGERMSELSLVNIQPRPAVFSDRDDPDARFWNDIDWTGADQDVALAQGWRLWPDEDGVLRIEPDPVPQPGCIRFADAEEAFDHVQEGGRGGHAFTEDYRALCRKAIAAAGETVEG